MKAIENWKAELARGGEAFAVVKYPNRYLSKEVTLASTICYSNDTTKLYTYERNRGLQIYKITEKINHIYRCYQFICQKWKKELRSLMQTIRIYSQDIGDRIGIGNMIHAYNKNEGYRNNEKP